MPTSTGCDPSIVNRTGVEVNTRAGMVHISFPLGTGLTFTIDLLPDEAFQLALVLNAAGIEANKCEDEYEPIE